MRPSHNLKYIKEMELAKQNMQKALFLIHKELIPITKSENLEQLKNIHKNRILADPKYLCFDDIWDQLKVIFDSIIDEKSSNFHRYVLQFKEWLIQLEQAGIPFRSSGNLNFWSTQFARVEAERYAMATSSTTDTLAFTYLRRILLEWPEEDLIIFRNIIYEIHIERLYLVFWTAVSDLYLDCALDNSEAHVFFQDSLTVGNFFLEY